MTEFLRKAPFIKVLVPFISGLIAGFYIHAASSFVLLLLLITFLIAIGLVFRFKFSTNIQYRPFFGVLGMLFFVEAGFFLANYQYFNIKSKTLPEGKNISITLKLTEPLQERSNSYSSIVEVVNFSDVDSVYYINTRLLLYFQKSNRSKKLNPGDIIKGSLGISKVKKTVTGKDDFDYSSYLFKKGVRYSGYADSIHWNVVRKGEILFIQHWAYSCRDKLLELLHNNGFKGDELGVISALTIGYKGELNKDVKAAYSAAGVMHILAVSGMHVGLIYIVITWLLTFMDKIKYGKYYKQVLVIGIIWFYALLTGLSPSINRAAFMITLVCVGNLSGRKQNTYNTLAIAAFVLLVINPYNLFDVGFQLSFVAITGILVLYPQFNKMVASNTIINKIWSLVAVSISAQIATFPLSLYYFHQFPNYFIIANLLVIPLATLLIYGSILMIVFSGIGFILTVMGKIVYYLVVALNTTVYFIDHLPFSVSKNLNIGIEEVLFIYIAITMAYMFYIAKKPRYIIGFLSSLLVFIWIGLAKILF